MCDLRNCLPLRVQKGLRIRGRLLDALNSDISFFHQDGKVHDHQEQPRGVVTGGAHEESGEEAESAA